MKGTENEGFRKESACQPPKCRGNEASGKGVDMALNLKDQRILITGASSGIGEATARLLASAGASVALVSEREAELNAVVQAIGDAGGRALAWVADFSQPEQVEGLVCRVEEQFGPLDALVNNAGVGMRIPVMDMREENLRFLFEVNFFALASLCQQALRAMAPRKQGRIVNVSSATAYFGCANMSAYSAAKGAVHTYTQALRGEALEMGIHVSEILPISVQTPFFDNVKEGKYRPRGVVLTVEAVAKSIVRCLAARNPRPEVLPYLPVRAVFVLNTLLPGILDRLAAKRFMRRQ